jgi:hypothetical protein
MERKLKPKQQRRLARHLRNVAKDQQHKKEAWESGKLIKPNHNNNAYEKDYSDEDLKILQTIITDQRDLKELYKHHIMFDYLVDMMCSLKIN